MIDKSEQEILAEFIHENTEIERLEKIIDDFNIFTALNLVNNEIKHSNFLSWLMNPNESHGLGDYFLNSFLKKISFKASLLGVEGPSIFDIDSWRFNDAEVLRERSNIDIIIRCDNQKFICILENKIYSKEHDKQLKRYIDTVKREYPDYAKLFVYLTIEGEIPTETEYIPLSYSDIVILVENLLSSKKDKLSPEILTFITQYEEIIRRYIMKDSEIQEICRKIYKKHKKAIDLIFEYKPDRQLEIYNYLVDMIEKDNDLILDDSSKSYIRFIPRDLDFIPKKGEGWDKLKRILLFQINNIETGINLILVIGPGEQSIREKLYNIARKDLTLFKGSKRKLTKMWLTIYKRKILESSKYEDMEIDEIKEILEKKLIKFKSSDLIKIKNEFKKYHNKNVRKN